MKDTTQRTKEIRKLSASIGAYMGRKHGSRPPTLDKLQLNPKAAELFDWTLDDPPPKPLKDA